MRISVLILKHMAFSSPDCSKKSEQSISFWNSKYSLEEKTPNLPIELPLRAVIWGTKFSYFEKIQNVIICFVTVSFAYIGEPMEYLHRQMFINTGMLCL